MSKLREQGSAQRALGPAERARPAATQFFPDRYMNLPSNPEEWYPEQRQGLEFASKLLGTAEVFSGLMKTEAGHQYKEASARAARGEFTIDESGLFTFTGAQQRALSEVEGANAGNDFAVKFQEASVAKKQELAANAALTPAERLSAYDTWAQQQAAAALATGKDSDYILAMADNIQKTVQREVVNYHQATVGIELERQQGEVDQFTTDQLDEMPLDADRIAYTKEVLEAHAMRSNIVSGGDPEAGVPYVKRVVAEAIAKGDVELLEGLSAMSINGQTLGSRGIINARAMEQAEERAKRIEDDAWRSRQRLQTENNDSIGARYGQIQQAMEQLSMTTDVEERESMIGNILNSIDQELNTVAGMDAEALSYGDRTGHLERLRVQRERLLSGDTLPYMSPEQAAMIRALRADSWDAAANLMLPELGRVRAPDDLKPLEQYALNGNAAKRNEELVLNARFIEALQDTVLESDPPVDGRPSPNMSTVSGMLESISGQQAQRRWYSIYSEVRAANPTMDQEAALGETFSRFRNEFKGRTPEERNEAQWQAKTNAGLPGLTLTASANNSLIRDLAARIGNDEDVNAVVAIGKSRGWDDIQVTNAKALITGRDILGASVNPEDYVVDAADAKALLKGAPTLDINWTPTLYKKEELQVFIRDESGKLAVKGALEITPEDKVYTPAFARDGVVITATGERKKIAELSEAEITALTQADRAIPSNPHAENYNAKAISRAELRAQGFEGNAWMGLNYSNKDKPLSEHFVVTNDGRLLAADKVSEKDKGSSSIPFDPEMRIETTDGKILKLSEFFNANLARGITQHGRRARVSATVVGDPIAAPGNIWSLWSDQTYANIKHLTPVDQMSITERLEAARSDR